MDEAAHCDFLAMMSAGRVVAVGTPRELQEKYARGGGLDRVFMNGAEHVVDLVNSGLVAPLDKYIANWPDLRDFAPATLQNSALYGHQYGIPLYTDTRSFWYRADFFEEAGLDPDSPPTTWSGLIDAAKRLTKTDGNRVIRQGFDLVRWTGNQNGLQDYVVYLWQNGGELVNPNTFEAVFNSTAGIEAMQFMVDLQDAVRMQGYTVDAGTGSGSPIVRGTAAINLNTGAVASETHKLDPDLVKHMRAIVPPPGQKNRVSVTFSNWLAIHSDSKQKDLAWEFIKHMTEAQTLAKFDSYLGTISPRRSTVSKFVRDLPLVSYIYQTLDYARPFPVYPYTNALGAAFAGQYKQIINGTLGVKTGLDEAARLWNLALKEGE
jgi:ABC-type glycerol-3-phosphate transport system substrate-binding protein